VVREQGPGVDHPGPRLGEGGEAGDEVFAVRVIPEDGRPFDAAQHHVVERSGRRFRTQGGRASRRAWRGMADSHLPANGR
jgi:hypothetical protein